MAILFPALAGLRRRPDSRQRGYLKIARDLPGPRSARAGANDAPPLDGAGFLESLSLLKYFQAKKARFLWRYEGVFYSLLAVMILSGCAPYFKPTGYHTSYEELVNPDDQSDLFLARAANIDQFPDCYAIYLAPTRAYGPILTKDTELRDELIDLFPKLVYRQMIRYYQEEGLQISANRPDIAALALDGKSVYELETAITEVRKGFGPARWILGFYLGHTTLQIEGRLRTLPDRQEVARFAVRVLHGGSGNFGFNPKALSARYCLRVSSDWAAYDLAELPALVFGRERIGRVAWEKANPEKAAARKEAAEEAARAAADKGNEEKNDGEAVEVDEDFPPSVEAEVERVEEGPAPDGE